MVAAGLHHHCINVNISNNIVASNSSGIEVVNCTSLTAHVNNLFGSNPGDDSSYVNAGQHHRQPTVSRLIR